MRASVCLAASCVLAASAPSPAGEFNMKVSLDGLTLGTHVMGPKIETAQLSGSVVLVEFWGINCPPCRASLPILAKSNTEHSSSGLVIIGVHCQGGSAEAVKKLCEEKGVNFGIYNSGRLAGGHDFRGIPHCFLFDHTGACVYRGSPFRVEGKIKQALDAAPAGPLAGAELVKLKPLSDALKRGAKAGVVLKKARSAAKSSKDDLSREGALVVERLEAWAAGLLQEAKDAKDSDPLRASENLQTLVEQMRYEPVGKEAAGLLKEYKKDAAFAKALEAGKTLAMIRKLEKMLHGSPRASTKRAVLSKMRSLVRKMRRDYEGTKATAEAEEIAEKHGI